MNVTHSFLTVVWCGISVGAGCSAPFVWRCDWRSFPITIRYLDGIIETLDVLLNYRALQQGGNNEGMRLAGIR